MFQDSQPEWLSTQRDGNGIVFPDGAGSLDVTGRQLHPTGTVLALAGTAFPFLPGVFSPVIYLLMWSYSLGSGMVSTVATSPKPSLRASWSVANTMVIRGNAGWTTKSKSIHSCLCHICSWWSSANKKRLEEDLCWIVPHVPLTTQSVKELNWSVAKVLQW